MTAVWAVACGLAGLAVGAASELLVLRVPRRYAPDDRDAAAIEPYEIAEPTPLEPDDFAWGFRPIALAIATGALWAALGAHYGGDAILPAFLVLAAALVPLSAIDLELFLLPNRIVYPLTVVMLALITLAAIVGDDATPWKRSLASGVGLFVVFFILFLLAPGGGLGFGDVKLSLSLGFALGWLSLGALFWGIFLGFLYGALVGIGLIVVRGFKARKQAVPFGPFLAAGTLTVLLLASSTAT